MCKPLYVSDPLSTENMGGGGLTTYKELCSLASDMNQPEMIYQVTTVLRLMWHNLSPSNTLVTPSNTLSNPLITTLSLHSLCIWRTGLQYGKIEWGQRLGWLILLRLLGKSWNHSWHGSYPACTGMCAGGFHLLLVYKIYHLAISPIVCVSIHRTPSYF